jgi:hypothetical protein
MHHLRVRVNAMGRRGELPDQAASPRSMVGYRDAADADWYVAMMTPVVVITEPTSLSGVAGRHLETAAVPIPTPMVDQEDELVDQAVLHQRLDQLAAAQHDDVLPGCSLSLAKLGGVAR